MSDRKKVMPTQKKNTEKNQFFILGGFPNYMWFIRGFNSIFLSHSAFEYICECDKYLISFIRIRNFGHLMFSWCEKLSFSRIFLFFSNLLEILHNFLLYDFQVFWVVFPKCELWCICDRVCQKNWLSKNKNWGISV